jgi:hypothetical protein
MSPESGKTFAIYGTHVPVEEPSTASIGDMARKFRTEKGHLCSLTS